MELKPLTSWDAHPSIGTRDHEKNRMDNDLPALLMWTRALGALGFWPTAMLANVQNDLIEISLLNNRYWTALGDVKL